MTHLLILDIGHLGKRDGLDPGVVTDVDGDGISGESGEREIAATTGVLYRTLAQGLEPHIGVETADWGWYSDRHRRAGQIALAHPGVACLYVQLHADIPGAPPRALFDRRSTLGRTAAGRFGGAGYVATEAYQGGPWERAWRCIEGIWTGPANLCGLCVELGALPVVLGDLDHAAHRLHAAIHLWAT